MSQSSWGYGNIGTRLKQARKDRHYTQVQLGNVVGVNHSNISIIETGRGLPSIELLCRLCNILNITPAALLIKNSI